MKIKTFYHKNPEDVDKEVNDFENSNKVKATQSYFAHNVHVRVLFYEE